MSPSDRLAAIRRPPRRRMAIASAGTLVGLAVATVHWSGFLLAGVLIGIAAGSLREAVAAAAIVGLLTVVAFLGFAWWHGQASAVVSLGELTVVAMVIPLVLLILGSLVRGLG